MNRSFRSRSHVTDMLFTLGLFCIFAAAAFILVMIGIQVYQRTVEQMQDTYSTRTAISYVAEKVRQHDVAGGVELTELEGVPALRLTDSLNGEDYDTYIYSDGGYLCELTVRQGAEPALSLGERILQVKDFSVEDAGGGFLAFSASSSDGGSLRFLLHTRSGWA